MKKNGFLIVGIALLVGIFIGQHLNSFDGIDHATLSGGASNKGGADPNINRDGSMVSNEGNHVVSEMPDRNFHDKPVHFKANIHGVSRKDNWVKKHEQAFVQNLKDLGVAEEEIGKLTGRRANLVELANAEKVFRQEMQKERLIFLGELKKNISPEMYEIFEETERVKGSDREFIKMAESGNPVETYLSREKELDLKVMLADHDMLTTESWDGPLDPLPNPLVGKVAVREHMVQSMQRLEGNLPILVSSMIEAGFENETIDSVRAYYESEIAALDRGYASLLDENQISVTERVEKFNQLIAPQIQQNSRQNETARRVQEQFDTVVQGKP